MGLRGGIELPFLHHHRFHRYLVEKRLITTLRRSTFEGKPKPRLSFHKPNLDNILTADANALRFFGD